MKFYLKSKKGTPPNWQLSVPKYVGLVLNEESHYYTILGLRCRTKRGNTVSHSGWSRLYAFIHKWNMLMQFLCFSVSWMEIQQTSANFGSVLFYSTNGKLSFHLYRISQQNRYLLLIKQKSGHYTKQVLVIEFSSHQIRKWYLKQ